MLLASPDVRVLAITVSPGALSAENAYLKVKSLLNSFWHEGVPVGINRTSDFKSPDFPVALNTLWGDETGIDLLNAPDCVSVIKGVLSAETTKVSFICLGGMSTVSLAMKEIPVFRQKIKEIIWSSNGTNDKKSFNFQTDVPAAEKVIKGDIPLKCITGCGTELFYDEQMINRISLTPNVYASAVSDFFKAEAGKIDARSARQKFTEVMDDDFNTPQALAILFDIARDINRGNEQGADVSEARHALKELVGVLGLTLKKTETAFTDAAPFIELLIKTRKQLRDAKQFKLADEIRDKLLETGVIMEDTVQGTTWKRKK